MATTELEHKVRRTEVIKKDKDEKLGTKKGEKKDKRTPRGKKKGHKDGKRQNGGRKDTRMEGRKGASKCTRKKETETWMKMREGGTEGGTREIMAERRTNGRQESKDGQKERC
ncbi:hypothetical protein GOODEAATRI_010087 [Goodea atripinnis]|uniref:Uncharacterized protein n=1 Tax=Goodea atripinnis TaxID=208336 RepID=A0ABV0P572_9TELE